MRDLDILLKDKIGMARILNCLTPHESNGSEEKPQAVVIDGMLEDFYIPPSGVKPSDPNQYSGLFEIRRVDHERFIVALNKGYPPDLIFKGEDGMPWFAHATIQRKSSEVCVVAYGMSQFCKPENVVNRQLRVYGKIKHVR